MTRLEELTLNLADDLLSDEEARELEASLAESERACQLHIRLLEIEAGLRAERQDLELASSIMARLRDGVADSIAQGVMAQIRAQPMPERSPDQSSAEGSANGASRVLPFPLPARRMQRLLTHVWLPLAACLVLMAGAGVWFFGPTRGEPVLAEVQGTGFSLERAGQRSPASAGTRLQSGDLLRTADNVTAAISFTPEDTRITIQPGTELKLESLSRGKHFALRIGKIGAAVARQRPLRTMVVVTPQAEARVLGTQFTLEATTNATTLEVIQGKVRFTRASDGKWVKVGTGNSAVVAANYELAALPATGRILREYWTNLANNSLSAAGATLKSKRSLVARPDGFDDLPRFQSVPLRPGLRFTERIRGYVHPPKTGLYRFALTTVHVETVLHLSRTDRPEDVVQVAFRTPNGIGPSLQEVTPVPLEAGRKYYIEVVHESDGGDDHLTVTWQAPGREPEIIPGKFLSPFPAQEKKGQR